MKWTTDLPKKTGWYWLRHTVGSIPDDTIIHCVIMRHPVKRRGRWVYKYDERPSAIWRKKWTDVANLPKGYRWQWSDRPIRLPSPANQLFATTEIREAKGGK